MEVYPGMQIDATMTLDNSGPIIRPSQGGGIVDPLPMGLYGVTLVDGTKVVVDDAGRVVEIRG